MVTAVNANYAALSMANRSIIDEMVDFLFAKQQKNKQETLEAIRDADEGRTVGPFSSIDDLTEALDADD